MKTFSFNQATRWPALSIIPFDFVTPTLLHFCRTTFLETAVYYKSFLKNNDFVFSNDEWNILKVSLEGFNNARSGPWGHLRHHLPVRKYAFFSMSFMKSAASLKSKIRKANSAFSVLVCLGFEPPNKLSISYALQSFTWYTPCVCQWIPVTGSMR